MQCHPKDTELDLKAVSEETENMNISVLSRQNDKPHCLDVRSWKYNLDTSLTLKAIYIHMV